MHSKKFLIQLKKWYLILIISIIPTFFLFENSIEAIEVTQSPKKVVYFIPGFWGNIFNSNASAEMRMAGYDLEPMFRLQKVASESGFDLRVADPSYGVLKDLNDLEPVYPQSFAGIFAFETANFQLNYLSKYPKEKLILVLWEPPTTMGQNYDPAYHSHFSRVYTWNDELVDNKKYFKIYYPVLHPMINEIVDFDAKKLCTLIAGNKKTWAWNELYSERRKIIDYFEAYHSSDFDLYGKDWPSFFKTYKGPLDSKTQALKNYKFAITYENGRDIPGYVTEKIFDCFQAGCVPVYWGASNIESYVPKNCFIARQDFKTHEELYQFLAGMTKEKYEEYIKNIQIFLKSEKAQLYSFDNFIKIMMDAIKSIPDESKTTNT
ncbi:MAG: hypothetical protein H0W88_03990 [Parachlamydiaceae bacterium]|nr:hypothetical protein [Parachlamydiaceae bacterium]